MNFSKPRYKGHRGRSSSFKRSIHYITHDKEGAGTDRVGFVALLNLATDDPAHAAREMQTTVDAAKALQARARIADGKRPGASGKDIEHPVYAFSLSWHPSEKPSSTEMLRAARDALKTLGLQDHQAVIASHRDRPHPHVHVVVSIVHPDTGRIANLHRDELKLDRWAHQYEENQKVFRSFKRAAKHDPRVREKTAAQKVADNIRAARLKRVEQIKAKHVVTKAVRQEERDSLWTQYQEQKRAVYDKYKDLFGRLRQPTFALNLKPPPKQADASWKEIAKAMRPPHWHYERSMNGFRHAIIARVPHNTLNATSRNFAWSRDARTKEDLQPLRRQLNLIQAPGRTWLARRELTNHLKTARNAELAELALAHLRRTEGLEKVHAKAEDIDKKDWEQLKADSDKIWENWRAEFKQPVKQYKERSWGQLVSGTQSELKPEFGKAMERRAVPAIAVGAKEPAKTKEQPAKTAARTKPPAKQYYMTTVSRDEAARQFEEKIRDAGLLLSGPIQMDGNKHYERTVDAHPTKKPGEYCVHHNADGSYIGYVKNYKSGLYLTLVPDGGERVPISAEQRRLSERQAETRTMERAAAKQAAQDNAALKARLVVEQCRPASHNHPYLVSKNIDRHNILQDAEGRLVIPRQNAAGELRSYQTIARNGEKLYQKDGETIGTFFIIGDPSKPGPLYEAEGVATGISVHEATGQAVFVAFDKGNLVHVAKAMREEYPDREIFIAGDNDQWTFTQQGFEQAGRPDKDNIPGDDPRWVEWRADGYLVNGGLEAAHDAAELIGGTVIVPPIGEFDTDKNKDWNDYANRWGSEATMSCFPSAQNENEQGTENEPPSHGFENGVTNHCPAIHPTIMIWPSS